MKRLILALAITFGLGVAAVPAGASAGILNQCVQVGAAAYPTTVPAGGSVTVFGYGTCLRNVTHTMNGVTYTTTEQAAQFRLRLQQGVGPVFTFADWAPGMPNTSPGQIRWTVPTSPLAHGTIWTAYVDVCAYVAPTGCVGPVSTAVTSFTVK